MTPTEVIRSQRAFDALAAAGLHFALAAVAAALKLLDWLPPQVDLLSWVRGLLPAALVAVSLGLVFAVLSRLRGGRAVGLALFVACGLILIVDQAAFAVLLGPMPLGLVGDWREFGAMASSAWALLDWSVALMLVSLVAAGIALTRGRGAVLALPILLPVVLWPVADPAPVADHPIAAVLAQAGASQAKAPSQPIAGDLYRLRFGVRDEAAPAAEDPAIAEAVRAFDRDRPRNLVLVVLESTSSQEALGDDGPDPAVLPNLARLYRTGLAFENVYVGYPGSAAANVAIQTGGLHPTWRDLKSLSRHGYRGPTLASTLKAAGYRTGLFAAPDLSYLGLRSFMAQAGFDRVFDFGSAAPEFQAGARLNSWGGRDDANVARALEWVAEGRGGQSPFFLEIMTNSPHHPYTVAGRPGTGDQRADYLAALQQADLAIGQLLRGLAASGELESTLVAITSDHGEPFVSAEGPAAGGRAALTEQAVRSFLLMAMPDLAIGPVRSRRIGAHGDIAVTLLARLGVARPKDLPGRDLAADRFEPGMVYFHYEELAGRWGLRDGRWKYVGLGSGEAALYDLSQDGSATNLADRFPDRATTYAGLASQWFEGLNQEFTARLEGHKPPPVGLVDATALRYAGVGHLQPEGGFKFSDALHPDAAIRFRARLGADHLDDAKRYRIQWIGPDGADWVEERRAPPGRSVLSLAMPGARPAVGPWRVILSDEDRILQDSQFVVSDRLAPPRLTADQVNPLRHLAVERMVFGKRTRVTKMPAEGPFVVTTGWWASAQMIEAEVVLVSPDGEGVRLAMPVPPDTVAWNKFITPPGPMAPGTWQVLVVVGEELVGETSVEVVR